MSRENMENYRQSIRHIVRPNDPTQRADADSVALRDFEALYLYEGFIEYAAYEAETRTEEQIALGYAEYIDMSIRDEGKNIVRFYAHTSEAKDVLAAAPYARSDRIDGIEDRIETQISEALHE